ncbi:beta-N-acetylhexosaminidase [Paenibacillus nasutitermitis]|uniref:Glycoside hydrolase family 20 n=1 Tax=Paenibacillus nasutitermitis TaxID=1652958 RepID=A0A916ZHE7_9BACL|nr:beta-N-acetylhexosaminidase [Paenibacillus nasutitermitis]GGD96101.1 glycoside hydrolase family 20 [Paenibacillus nasutitermitis]
MKLSLYGEIGQVEDGIRELVHAGLFDWSEAGDSIPVAVIRRSGDIYISLKDGQGRIEAAEPHHFYRALGLFIEHAKTEQQFEVVERPRFDFNGPMLDVSRNAVLKPAVVKQFIRYIACMGLNGLMLYAEDTYEVPNRPYFGYMRGRYTVEELKELDDYAFLFGIEIIPCIQTLAHLAQALKWPYASAIKDHPDILLVGEPQTYVFIEEMIASASAPFRSKRIHIGMDEAFGLGLGRYLELNGYRDRFEIINEHVSQVLEITRKYDLKPIIWSDMYFHFLSNEKHAFHYSMNVDFSKERLEQIPQDVQFVYWDYGNRDQAVHERILDKHKAFGSVPLFAGGIHLWGSMSPNYGKTWMSSHPALLACKSQGVREVLATAWGDNGQETNHLVMLPGLQLFAEHGYSDEVDDDKLRRRFAACTGLDLFDELVGLKAMDEVPGIEQGNHFMANPSKYLLWQDLLLGLFDKHVEGEDGSHLPAHYSSMAQQWRDIGSESPSPFNEIFYVYEKLSEILAVKSTLGVEITAKYRNKDKGSLQEIARKVLPNLHDQVNGLRQAHRKLWMLTYKPFGWEVLDIRYGGLMARISSASERILDYAEGRESVLEELECERLLFEEGFAQRPLQLNAPGYSRIVSASPLG